ncbi:MAG: hypothetical protein H6739_17795 [Alphaproteobacteria bacterium]|nr:hypothetical protein [Alphaproteobacteria bacterium]
MRSLSLFILVLLAACAKQVDLHYASSAYPGVSPSERPRDGVALAPLGVGLYQLTDVPAWLGDASCERLATSDSAEDSLDGFYVPEVSRWISVLEEQEDVVVMDRDPDARWLLIVPFYRDKCTKDVDDWVLVRLRRGRAAVFVALDEYDLHLPWVESFPGYARLARQRGCVERRAHHVPRFYCD